MLAKTRFRRPLAILLVIAGALMMFLAPETWAGILLLVLGITIEILGITIKHRDEP